MKTIKTIGSLTYSHTSEFQQAVFLNDPYAAYEVLDERLGPGGWYPENTDRGWTDIAVLEGKYYAAFGEDSVMTQDAKLVYIEIEPTSKMKEEFNYISGCVRGRW